MLGIYFLSCNALHDLNICFRNLFGNNFLCGWYFFFFLQRELLLSFCHSIFCSHNSRSIWRPEIAVAMRTSQMKCPFPCSSCSSGHTLCHRAKFSGWACRSSITCWFSSKAELYTLPPPLPPPLPSSPSLGAAAGILYPPF